MRGKFALDSAGRCKFADDMGFHVDPETIVELGRWVDNPKANHYMEKQKWEVTKVTFRVFCKELEELLIALKEPMILHKIYKTLVRV